MSSYYATPSSSPVLLQNILQDSTSYYPSPANTTATIKRQVFENAVPLCIPKTKSFQKLATKYLDTDLTTAGVNTSYSINNLNGYITVPIGDLTFMTANSIN